jgi:LPPG:FO 2-phospho-L-lactate transferase
MPETPSVAVLCGGFGAARFVPALAAMVPDLTCIVNTADDLDHLGLHISPDVDSVCYALAGRFDETRGWGLVGDTFHAVDALARDGSGWFRIGDEDLGFSLLRTARLRRGVTLRAATARMTEELGVAATVLPMSDDPVRTIVHTDAGELDFQDYLVHRRAQPCVRGVDYRGLPVAEPAPGVLPALEQAGVVVIAPSSPVASITPILRLSGVLDALHARRGPTVAVTPVVSGQAPGSPPEQGRAIVRSALMQCLGLTHRAAEVARLYASFLDGFVLDYRDADQIVEIESLGLQVVLADTLAPAARPALAEALVQFSAGGAGTTAPSPSGAPARVLLRSS